MTTYFTKLDNSLTVTSVYERSDGDDGKELSISDITNHTYRQTYSDGSKRKNFAGIGFTYDKDKDAFIPPKPYASWVLDASTCRWKAPVTNPADLNTKEYSWDETNTKWVAD